MEIVFKTAGLQKDMTDTKRCVRRYGADQARLLRRRLDEFRAAETLADIARLPGPRCHEYTQDRKGQLSVDLRHPYRLIFEPADDPVPRKEDGGLDWQAVKAVRILEVYDPHG